MQYWVLSQDPTADVSQGVYMTLEKTELLG